MNQAFTDTLVDVGGRIGVVRRARGAGIPLVLIPGCGGDHHAFDPLLTCLPGREVVVVCLPGRSGVPGPAPASAADAASYVRSVLNALGIGRAVVGGHSYGGGVALELALSGGDVVAALVLLDTGARLRAHPDILAAAEAAALAEPSAAANLADWRACNAFDRMREVGQLAVPTLVVVGADDVFTPPRYSHFLAEKIAGARLVTIDGAGHDAPTTHPMEVGAAIAGFLDAVDGGAR